MVGGASHAERLANALGHRHGNVADLTLAGRRLTEEAADDLASDISGIMMTKDVSKVIIVLQIFDNSVYKGLIGKEIMNPVKLDGRYHIPGKLVVIGQDELKELFGLATKVIRAAQGAPVIIISPLYRYVTGRCCRDSTHISNYEDTNFTRMMGNSIQSICKQIRSLVWHRHWGNIQVVNPAVLMGIGIPNLLSSDEADVQIAGLLQRGGSDLVHPTGEAYSLLAERLLAKLAEAVKKPVEKKSLEAPPGSKKRKRSPSCDRRPS